MRIKNYNKLWNCYHIKCDNDCKSILDTIGFDDSWSNSLKEGESRQCRGCNKELSDDEIEYLGSIRTTTKFDAIAICRRKESK